MADVSYAEVWEKARQLPLEAQIELAEKLLHSLRNVLTGKQLPAKEGELAPLIGLSREELEVLAKARLAPERQEELEKLLQKNREGTLTPAEEKELDELLAEVDRIALLKARAMYTLKNF